MSQINIRNIPRAEMRAIKAAAKLQNLSVSEWIRRACWLACGERPDLFQPSRKDKRVRLSEATVVEIRSRAGNVSQAELASEFGVSEATVSRIVNDQQRKSA